MNGVDDLARIDSREVDRSAPEVCVPDDRQRDPFGATSIA
jgi:hypothetical protein